MRAPVIPVLALVLGTTFSASSSLAREEPSPAEHLQAKKGVSRAMAAAVFVAGVAGLLSISRYLSRRAVSQDADETVARELREFDERQARALARKRREEQGAS
jgi:hypothetical protein